MSLPLVVGVDGGLAAALAAALGLGLLGSLHCAAMCGPLLVAGCSDGPRRRPALAYFGGRFAGHVFAGAVAGHLGARAGQLISSTSLQRWLLLLVAGAALAKGLGLLSGLARPGRLVPLARLRRRPALSRSLALVASLLPRRGLPLGLATAALPCGLLAGGWALAASTGHPLSGALTMAVFSLASAPALGATLLLTTLRWRPAPAWQGLLWCGLGLWIGLRPLLAPVGCH